jgi:hypothetical protein
MVVIEINKVVKAIGVIIIFLVIMSTVGQIIKYSTGHNYIYGFIPKFNLNDEQNIPTYFSTILLFISGVLLACIAITCKKEENVDILYWKSLSIIFLLLSIDELASIHERVADIMEKFISASGFFYFAWVLPAIIFILLLSFCYIKFFLRLDKRTKVFFLLSGSIFIAGALGLEIYAGYILENISEMDFRCEMIAILEEACEMIGVTIFIYALLDYLHRHRKEIVIDIKS